MLLDVTPNGANGVAVPISRNSTLLIWYSPLILPVVPVNCTDCPTESDWFVMSFMPELRSGDSTKTEPDATFVAVTTASATNAELLAGSFFATPIDIGFLVIVMLAEAEFPATSVDVTVMILSPGCSIMPLTDQEAFPSQAPLPPLLFDHLTLTVPNSAETVPKRFIVVAVVVYAGSLVGVVMVTVDGRLVTLMLAEAAA